MNNIDYDPMIPLDFNLTDDTKDAIAVTVYIIKDGKVLLLNQTKSHTVVPDLWVGIGGKTPVQTYLSTTSEKTNHQVVISSLYTGDLQIPEHLEQVAAREVNEETGLTIDPAKLQDIGSSTVRLRNHKTDELWRIFNYVYNADGTEGQLSECDEGTLEWFPIEQVPTLPMHRHDKIIFNEKDPSTSIETIIDDINSEYRLRITKEKNRKKIHILLPSFKSEPHTIKGVITKPTDYQPGIKDYLYNELPKHLPPESLKSYLDNLGIFAPLPERAISGFSTPKESPVELFIK